MIRQPSMGTSCSKAKTMGPNCTLSSFIFIHLPQARPKMKEALPMVLCPWWRGQSLLHLRHGGDETEMLASRRSQMGISG